MNQQHVISVKVENKFGVLTRVTSLFSARGYNIESLSVSKTEDDHFSVITLVVPGDIHIIEQVKKQLNKLINVIKVTDHTEIPALQRELCIIKLNVTPAKRIEIYHLADIFKAEIVDISKKTLTLEVVGDPTKINNFIDLVRPYHIKELIRTGRVSMSKE